MYFETIHPNNWIGVRRNFQKINSYLFGPLAEPTFASITLTGLTDNSLVYPVSGVLTSLGEATDGQIPIGDTGGIPILATIIGTANEIDVTNAAGSITIGLVNPLIVAKGGTGIDTLTNHGLLLGSGVGAITPLAEASNGQLPIGSTGADPVLATLSAGAGVAITNAAGSITVAVDGVLEDLDTLGACAADGEFLVGTGAGALAWESGATVRTSLGLGTGDSPTFTDITTTGDFNIGGDILPDTDATYDIGIIIPPSGLTDYFDTGDDNLFGIIDATYWKGQVFTASETYDIASIKLLMYKASGRTPGTVTVSIRATTGTGASTKPTGGDLVSGTIDGNALTDDTDGEWVEITLDDTYALVADTQYAICVRCEGTNPNVIYLRRKSTGGYAGGHTCASSNSGGSWAATADGDIMFQTYGGGGEGDAYRIKDIYLSGDITDGTNATSAAEIAVAYAHVSSDGSDHTFIDQDVTTTGNPQFATIELGDADDTTITRTGAGSIAVEGVAVMMVGDAPTAHTHDGDTLQLDGINSDGGAFSFTTSGLVTFSQSIASANFAAANKLTACATNAGALDFSAGSKTLTVEDDATVSQDYSSDASPTFANVILADGGALKVTDGNPQIILDNTNGYIEMTGSVGIGIAIPVAALDVCNGNIALSIGADESGVVRTNETIKSCRITVPHYLNAEEPLSLMVAYAQETANSMYFGGGSNSANAATDIQFRTAANTTTTTGTSRLRIKSDGGVFMYSLKSGATQAAAGAAADELWHDTDDHTIKIGV